MKVNFVLLVLSLFMVSCTLNESHLLKSPNEELQLVISDSNNLVSFFVIHQQDTIINHSGIGLQVNGTNCMNGTSVTEVQQTQIDETWNTVNGKQPTIRNHYNEYLFDVSGKGQQKLHYKLAFRVYDDGFAYRYIFPSEVVKDSIMIDKELTKLDLKGDYTYWAFNGEKHNVGPIKRSDKQFRKIKTPAVLQLDNDKFMAIHEAAIFDFAPLSLNASDDDQSLKFNIDYTSRSNSFQTSWRTFIIGNRVGDLVESNLLVNLNEPCKIKDASWIKPGKSLWDWRVSSYQAEDGFTYGLNTKSHKRFIDFASENNIQNLLIDADWYGSEFSESSDPTSAIDGINIEECMAYAKDKNVGVILYLNDVGAKRFGLERVLKQFSEWGAVGVKYGFMRGNPEEKVKHTRKVVELCAKYKLLVDFHDGPVPPSGDRRTYPNLITKEYGHAQADAKSSSYPETSVNHALINMIAGPLDLTNGWFDLNNAHARTKVFEVLPGTVAAEVAKLIVVYTGWMVLPDSPEEYAKKDDLFECVRNIPPQFDGFKVLDAELDKYVCIVRKAGDDWFIGSLTNREERTLDINLDFLPENRQYEATFYEDADDSHFLNNKEVYKIRKQKVNSKTKVSVDLCEGGGNAIHLRLISDQ